MNWREKGERYSNRKREKEKEREKKRERKRERERERERGCIEAYCIVFSAMWPIYIG